MTLITLWRLLSLLSLAELTLGRGKVIDISNGEGDILQLRRRNSLSYYGGEIYRNALFNNTQRKWNVRDATGNIVIPYEIGGRYDAQERNIIKQAMKRIEDNTCIRFRLRNSERDYIDISNRRGEGCYTSVGRLHGRSILMLESNERSTCIEVQIVQHELLHVIGLWHEHMRYDRDKYIKVHYRNIRRGLESQFDKVSPREATVYNMPYDYKSVMHYPSTAFARPGTITMETLDKKYMNVIGRQTDASKIDYEKVCKIYGCQKCNGESLKPGGGDENPSTLAPKPTRPTRGKCFDVNSRFCVILGRRRILRCNGSHRKICCATCRNIAAGRRDDYFEFSYEDYD
ncbi:hypothetical protein KIN20_013844, partial [Parelaphostrongylus tenuis]